MKIKTICIGKSSPEYMCHGVDIFLQKLKPMTDIEWIELVPKKKTEVSDLAKKIEADLLLSHIHSHDYVILLDQQGMTFKSSEHFAEYLNKLHIASHKKIIFLIGGAFGFDSTIYDRANAQISMASMTFSHQMIRLIFLEQFYRGYAILNHLPYHHA